MVFLPTTRNMIREYLVFARFWFLDRIRPMQNRSRHLSFFRIAAFLAIGCLAALPGCVPEDADGAVASEPERPKTRTASVRGASVKPLKNSKEAQIAFRMVNAERAGRGMPPLKHRGDLDDVAYAHARDLLRMNKLSHISSDGRKLENRLANLDWEWAGENLARNKGFDSPAAEAVKGWIASPQHFENMFRADFTEGGMAALYDPESGFTYLVQIFITPVE